MNLNSSLTKVAFALIATALVVLAGTNRNASGLYQERISTEELSRGERVYQANCEICHGRNGNGRGMAAHMLATQPRDFSTGLFKFRSTPSGTLPTDADLIKVVTEGIRWTAMIGRADLPDSERRAVVQYLKTFSPRFANENTRSPIVVPGPPARSQDLIFQGRRLYQDADCAKCHGERADGQGISSTELVDDWDWPLPASDLTWRPLKRGSASRDIYLTIATGLNGTPMPAYSAALEPQQIWALVFYLDTLVPKQQNLSTKQAVGEEPRGRMILGMHGMSGHGLAR
jgi:cytochrome c oxidase cbb3-type subunit I/II